MSVLAFSRASGTYDSAASLQHSLVHALAEEVDAKGHQRVLDAGCGSGFLSQWCKAQVRPWQVLGIDAAFGMCKAASGQGAACMQADMQALPVAGDSVDGVFCASSLQWAADWAAAFAEFHRVLKPGGWLAVSVFVEGTLEELKHAFAQLDGYSHLLTFRPPEALFDAARSSGFAVTSYRTHRHAERVQSAAALMKHLKALGASGKSGAVRKGMMTPRQLARLEEAYRAVSPVCKASWSIATLIARKEQP